MGDAPYTIEELTKLVTQQTALILAQSKELADLKSRHENLQTRVEFYSPLWAQPPPFLADPPIIHPSLKKPTRSPTKPTFRFLVFFLSSVLPIDSVRIIISFIQTLAKPASLGPLSIAFKPKYEHLGNINRREPHSPQFKRVSCLTTGRNGKIYAVYDKELQIFGSESEIVVFDYNGEYISSFKIELTGTASAIAVNHVGNIVVVDVVSSFNVTAGRHETSATIREFCSESYKNVSNWSPTPGKVISVRMSKSGLIYIPTQFPEEQKIEKIVETVVVDGLSFGFSSGFTMQASPFDFPSGFTMQASPTGPPVRLCVYSPDKTLINTSDHQFLQYGVLGTGIDQDENFLAMSGNQNVRQMPLGIFSKWGEFLREISFDPLPQGSTFGEQFCPQEILVDKNGDFGGILQGSVVVYARDGTFKEARQFQSAGQLVGSAVDENGTLIVIYLDRANNWNPVQKHGFSFVG